MQHTKLRWGARSWRMILGICCGLMLSLMFYSPGLRAQGPQNVTNDWALTTAGKVRHVITNRGRIAGGAGAPFLFDCEFPPGSNEEHITWVGISIGGVTPEGDTLVSTGAGHNEGDELLPSSAPWDTVWVVERGDKPVDIGGQLEDGSEEIYWPHYTPVSDQDMVFRYNDYKVPNATSDHVPLYLDIIETVYVWSSPPMDEVLVRTYRIIPQRFEIEDMTFTLQVRGQIGQINQDASSDDVSMYFPDLKMIAHEDTPGGQDGTAYSPIGFMFMPSEKYADGDLRWTYVWGSLSQRDALAPSLDSERYRQLYSTGEIMENQQSPFTTLSWFSVGMFDVAREDTLVIRMAEVLGEGREGMLNNAGFVRELAEREFKAPSPPPPPEVRTERMNKAVKLNWKPAEGYNPEQYDDPNRADEVDQPFEGYRVYKSTQTKDGPWTLLAEYDIAGNSFGQNAGLERTYVDHGLLNNVSYYYTVTAFSKPDTVLPWASVESSRYQSAVEVMPGTGIPETVGRVYVVPNPYRGDVDYTQYTPPWEQSPGGRPWMEQDRRMQFVNLPERCKISIYTSAGNFVKTIQHQSVEQGTESWNMTSYANQAIASGVYLYIVEDLKTGNTQTGKFVVIK